MSLAFQGSLVRGTSFHITCYLHHISFWISQLFPFIFYLYSTFPWTRSSFHPTGHISFRYQQPSSNPINHKPMSPTKIGLLLLATCQMAQTKSCLLGVTCLYAYSNSPLTTQDLRVWLVTDPFQQVRKRGQHINFFTIPDYERWVETTPDAHKWDPKYYKVCCCLFVIWHGPTLLIV